MSRLGKQRPMQSQSPKNKNKNKKKKERKKKEKLHFEVFVYYFINHNVSSPFFFFFLLRATVFHLRSPYFTTDPDVVWHISDDADDRHIQFMIMMKRVEGRKTKE